MTHPIAGGSIDDGFMFTEDTHALIILRDQLIAIIIHLMTKVKRILPIYKRMDKNFYNKSSSDSLGWHPSWFGCLYFDNDLVKAVQAWQKSHHLTADGLVGPMTYRRIWTEREATISSHVPQKRRISDTNDKYIVHNGHFIPIKWDKVY